MPIFRFTSLLALAASIPLAFAHGSLQSVTVGGKDYPAWVPSKDHYAAINFANGAGAAAPDGQYSRKNDALDNGFIPDPTGPAIATGGVTEGALYDATSPVKPIPMNGGDAVTWNMGTWPEGHSGPILVHMASCPSPSCTGEDATTLSWFAIHHSGYSTSTSTWPTDTLARSPGATFTAPLPTDLPSGPYLLRFELIAMHSVPAQFYPWTVEIDLTSSGTSLPSSEYLGKFPDMYTKEGGNMALDFSLYTGNDLLTFVLPGVPVYPGGTSEGNDPLPSGSGAGVSKPAPKPEDEDDQPEPVVGGGNSTTTAMISNSNVLPTPTSLAAGSSIIPIPIASASASTSEAPPTQPTDSTPTIPTPIQGTPIETPSLPEESPNVPSPTLIQPIPTLPVNDRAPSVNPDSRSDTRIAPSAGMPTTTFVVPSEPSASAVQPAPGSDDEIQEVKINDRTMWEWNGQLFNYKVDAAYHRCDKIRNDCLNSANALPNNQVENARQACETEGPACYASIKLTRRSKKWSTRSQ